MKAAIKRNVGSAATSDEPHLEMAKVFKTPEAIASISGVWSEEQQEPMVE